MWDDDDSLAGAVTIVDALEDVDRTAVATANEALAVGCGNNADSNPRNSETTRIRRTTV